MKLTTGTDNVCRHTTKSHRVTYNLLASKLHTSWCIHVVLFLLKIRDIGIQVVFELFIYFKAYFHLIFHRTRLAAGLCHGLLNDGCALPRRLS